MNDLHDDWRNFIRHLGVFIIIIGALTATGLLIKISLPLIFWLGTIWGAALMIHLVTVLTEQLNDEAKNFIRHAGIYVIVLGALTAINVQLVFGNIIFRGLALLWGAAVAIHLLVALTEKDKSEKADAPPEATMNENNEDNEDMDEASRPTAIEKITQTDQPDAQAGKLGDQTLQTRLDKAVAYQAQIKATVDAATSRKAKTRLQNLAKQVDTWVESIEDLAKQIDDFKQNTLIHQDVQAVPESIARLEAQLAEETDPDTQAILKRTLTNRENQLAVLERLQKLMHQAEIQVESTLSSLGTIYSQILTDQSTNQVADYSHLSAEAEEETRLLQDHLEALAEVRLAQD